MCFMLPHEAMAYTYVCIMIILSRNCFSSILAVACLVVGEGMDLLQTCQTYLSLVSFELGDWHKNIYML